MSVSLLFRHVRDFMALLVDRFRHVRAQQVAAGLAFTTLLSLVPLIAVSLGVVSKFSVFDQVASALRGFLLDNLLPDKAGAVIAKYTLQFSQQANGLTAVGSLMLVGGAVVMLVTIDRAFNQIWQVSRPRPWLVRLLIYWVALTLGPVLLGGAVFGATQVISASLGLVAEPRWLREGAFGVLPAVLLTAFLTFLYVSVPNRRVRFCPALIGGVLAATALLVMQKLFGAYLSRLGSYTLIYGAFSVVPVFLLWLYVCWVTILVGALVAATLPEYSSGRRVSSRFAGRRYVAALLLLRALGRAQAAGQVCGLQTLAELSRVGIAETEAVLQTMRDLGWVEKTDRQRWLLARRLEDIGLDAVFERFALSLFEVPDSVDGETAAMLARLRAIHASAGAALSVPVASLLAEAFPAARSRG